MEFEVPWEHDGRVRHFRLTLADLLEAAKHFGTPTIPELSRRLQQLHYEDVPWMIWLGLRHEDPTLTPEQVAGWQFAVWPARDALMDAWCRTMNGRTAAEELARQERLAAEIDDADDAQEAAAADPLDG